MAHITFVHGILNKPPQDRLLTQWRLALARADGLDLGADGVTAEMVYWADVLYERPEEEEAAVRAEAATDAPEPAATAPPPVPTSVREASLMAGLAAKYGAVAGVEALVDATAAARAPGTGEQLERIPLPRSIKKRAMEAYLRDVHHYLFNVEFSPRAGENYHVQDVIRQRAVAALQRGAAKPGPHVVVSHSMGTVIAYDCLKRVADCPAVDALMTIGSPLGLDEIQDELVPEWTRADGFPRERVRGRWVNVYDRLDPVAGFDPAFANDFQRADAPVIEDIHEPNFGKWRHDISKYLAGPQLRAALRRLLQF